MSKELNRLSEQQTQGQASTSIDAAPTLLQLATQLHTAHADPQAWRDTLLAYRDRTPCHVMRDLTRDMSSLKPNDLAALAGRLTHCSNYGDECSQGAKGHRPLCGEFAVHMHTAALAAQKTLQAGTFDCLPPTWIVESSGHVREANAAAQALINSGERFSLVDGCLKPLAPSGALQLRRALREVTGDTRVFWNESDGDETTLLLRTLPGLGAVAVTLQPPRRGWVEVASMLAQHLGLTPRRSELGAHLLEGHTVAQAARVMGITRHTANEHLSALLLQVGAADRKALLVLLRRVAQR
jgi:DNA-binding CsgD family transcriptional regulator